MDNISIITYLVTSVKYGDTKTLWKLAGLSEKDWSIADAEQEFESILTKRLNNKIPCKTPVLDIVAGIPGSGKTTIAKKLSAGAGSAVLIQFDSIMEQLSYYHKLMSNANKLEKSYKDKADKLRQKAFERTELIARVVGYELLKRCVENNILIIFEHSSTPTQHVELYKLISEKGYKVNFIYKKVTIATALQRIKAREVNRFTPETYVYERYEKLEKLLPKYKKICTTFKTIENE